MNTTTLKPKELKSNHRAVAPVIATLLMVAIAVVGGTIIFVFSQGFFSSSQISGTPTIEAVKFLGYDATTSATLTAHDGNLMFTGSGGNGNQAVEQGERIAIYFTNDSVQKIVLGEIWFGGSEYGYIKTATVGLYDGTDIPQGNYTIVTSTPDGAIDVQSPQVEAGQTATIMLDLENDFKIGRGTQFKLVTANGAVYVSTVSIGQSSG